ncbi:hypothetical protein B0H14DRAFT_2632597 [Mycena olivaceomarginata]|nr:hypothetical protein B0H14DRAFT_2632597 [Mycena olivaceomarginata]
MSFLQDGMLLGPKRLNQNVSTYKVHVISSFYCSTGPNGANREDTEWHFHGNQNIIPESQHMAVLNFYQAHKSCGAQDAYFTKLPKHAALMKGRVLALKLSIDTPEEDNSPAPGTFTKKCTPGSMQVSKENSDPAKCPRISGAVGSTFSRKAPGPDPVKSTEISLAFAEITVNKETCSVEWKDEALFQGKHFYQIDLLLSIGTEQFVAKRFYEIGSGSDEVGMAENILNLECEAIRCEQARWFLRNFRSAAQDHNLETANTCYGQK